jgi:hypothetical protein
MNGSKNIWRYVTAYLLWAATLVLALLCAVAVRDTYRFLAVSSGANRYVVHAVDEFSILGLGIALLIFIIATEHSFRTGVAKGVLARRFFLVAGSELALLSVLHLFHFTVEVWKGIVDPMRLMILGLELGVAIYLFWEAHQRSKARAVTDLN